MSKPATLTYAPPPRRFRRPIMLTMIGLLAFIFALPVIVPALRWLRDRHELLAIQRACRDFSPSPQTIVFADGPDVSVVQCQRPYDALMRAGNDSFASLSFSRFDSLQLRTNTLNLMGALLFLHDRRVAGGNRAIVAVHLDHWGWHWVDNTPRWEAQVWVIEPVAVFSTQLPVIRRSSHALSMSGPKGDTRFFAGQPDPSDTSRFTIAYQIGDSPGVIDGVLNDDLTVTLTPRTGPLAATASPREAR